MATDPILLADGYFVEEDELRLTGQQRWRVTTQGSTRGVPKLGDKFSDSYQKLTARKRRLTLLGEDERREVWTVSYSSDSDDEAGRDASTIGGYNAEADELLREIDIGFEALNIGQQTGVTWDQTSNPVTVDYYKRNLIANVQITKIFFSFNDLLSALETYGGKVNSAVFLGRAAGQVLFASCSASEFINAKGQKKWQVVNVFAVKSIAGTETADGSAGGWNHLWDPDQQKFDTTSTPTYQSVNLNQYLELRI